MAAPEPIVVAVDGSPDSRNALLWALRTACGVQGRGAFGLSPVQVHLVHVIRPQDDFIMDGPEMHLIPKTVKKEIVDASTTKGERVLKEAENLWQNEQQKLGLESVVKRHLRFGDPRDQVVSVVDEVQAGLLVVGKRGLSAWQRVWLGSVSDYCTVHSSCPVACIPRDNPF